MKRYGRRRAAPASGGGVAIGRGTSEREPITVAEQTVEKLKSADNLMEAFTGESEANRKYLAYAKQAEKEGLAREPLTDPTQQIYARMWQPVYPPVEAI